MARPWDHPQKAWTYAGRAAAVGRLVDRLQDRKFILRAQSLDDRRAYTLSLTPDAESMIASLDNTGAALKADLLEGLSEEEISLLNRGLNKLKSNLRRASAAVVCVFPVRSETYVELQTTLHAASFL